MTDKAAAAVASTPNRVTLAHIESIVTDVAYHNPALCPHMTVAFVKLANGYVVTGESTPADPMNYDVALGQALAVQDALRKVWPLEGYLLRQRLAEGK